jgi:hypothetical protein
VIETTSIKNLAHYYMSCAEDVVTEFTRKSSGDERELGDVEIIMLNSMISLNRFLGNVTKYLSPFAAVFILGVGIFSITTEGPSSIEAWAMIILSPVTALLHPVLLAPLMSRVEAQVARVTRIERLEERSLQEPAQSKLAWDLARSKLESYLDRNLSQVNMIFMLTVAVMVCGMVLIGIGVARAIQDPVTTTPAVLSAVSGVFVQFVASTFLIIYRSTMEQARDYVVVLERINAVGMSINILEGIEGDSADQKMRNTARGELARDLLRMYGVGRKNRPGNISRSPFKGAKGLTTEP